MSKRAWLFPILIVAVNALAILIRWNALPETLPAHFDLQGTYCFSAFCMPVGTGHLAGAGKSIILAETY